MGYDRSDPVWGLVINMVGEPETRAFFQRKGMPLPKQTLGFRFGRIAVAALQKFVAGSVISLAFACETRIETGG